MRRRRPRKCKLRPSCICHEPPDLAMACIFARHLKDRTQSKKPKVFRLFRRRTAARKFLFPTFPFLVATCFLASKIWALVLWESERENFHSKSFPSNGSSFFPPKV